MEFSCRTRIYSGAGSLEQLRKLQVQKLLVVADPYFSQNGTAGRIGAMTGASRVEIFDKVTPDPSVELVAEATAVARELQPDALIGIGGGSTMDLAKAVAYFTGRKMETIMIPTTSGSGSEVTDFAVLTKGEVKLPLVSRDLLPDMAILDSELLENLPKSLVADCGFDVLGHCLEAYTAQNANGFTDALALAAFRCVLENLSVSYSGDLSVRGKIHQAATMAGLSFSRAGLGLCHAMAHSLGGVFHIPHGRLVAMLLPPIITCGAKVCSEKYAALARGVGLPGAANVMAVRNLTNALVNLRKSLHMPGSLQEAGIAPAQVLQHKEQILRATLQDPCCATAPVPVDMMQVSQILEAVTGRG